MEPRLGTDRQNPRRTTRGDSRDSGRLFRQHGYAKGTFYYYFKSKPDILEAIVNRTLSQIVEMTKGVADELILTAMQKMEALFGDSRIGDDGSLEVAEMLHLPENKELHELNNIQTVLLLSPVLAKTVEQGIGEGIFEVERPLETIQFLFTGAQLVTDGEKFGFSEA